MRESAFAQDIEAVSIEAIASIAATLTRQDVTPAIATSQAFELLELAAAGKRGVKHGGGWEENIARLEKAKAAYAARIAADYGQDISEKGVPVPFDAGLASVLRSLNRSMKPDNHEGEFRSWLTDAEGITSLEAGERIAAFRKAGIPRNIYQNFRLTYANWRRAKTREQRSASGKAGQEKKKKTRQRAS